jgi:hypothetical protein
MNKRYYTQFIVAAVIIFSVSIAKAAGSFKIENLQFTTEPAVKNFGYDYGIKFTLRTNNKDILDNNGDIFGYVDFMLYKNDLNTKPIKIVIKNQYNHEKPGDDPKIVDFYIFAPIAPSNNYVLSVKVGADTNNYTLKSSSDVAESVNNIADNAMDFNVSISPLLNKVDKFNAEYSIDTELFGFSCVKFDSKGTINEDATLKNGFVTNLSYNYFKTYEVGLGKMFNPGMYFWKAAIGIDMENDQQLTINKNYYSANMVFEIPYTNYPSMYVHKKYNILRSAPGLMLTLQYLQSMDKTDTVGFSQTNRGDVEAEYNLTLTPTMFIKSHFIWYHDFNLSTWLNYRENTLGILYDKSSGSFYFIKYVNGYYSTNFNLLLDELTAGITKRF